MIGLISCGAQKLDRPAPARELYCSTLFRLALAYAEPRCEHAYVLSAKLGLVELDAVIEPYDQRLAGRDERATWARAVANYLVLAGRDYAEPLAAALCVPRDRILQPLDGLMIGRRLRWLARAGRAEAA